MKTIPNHGAAPPKSPAGGTYIVINIMKHYHRYKDVPNYIKDLSRKNRVSMTPQEEMLWERISKKKLKGLKFRRQFPIGRYIVDFYNHLNKLIIEIDGSIHDSQKEYDENRDNYLESSGYTILRITNNEIEKNMDDVVAKISSNIKSI